MEKTNHVVITIKESKALKKLERLLEIMGVDLPSLCSKVEKLEAENKELRDENKALNEKIESIRNENEELIRNQMKQIAVNIQKSTSGNGSGFNVGKFNFQGKSIDESF